jgi:hypothetical protein
MAVNMQGAGAVLGRLGLYSAPAFVWVRSGLAAAAKYPYVLNAAGAVI